jgi:hypothetical protein
LTRRHRAALSFYGVQYHVADIDHGAPVTVVADRKPAWMRLGYLSDEGIYTLYGTPTNADVGLHEVVLLATDGTAVTEHRFFIEVTYTNQAPQFLGTPPAAANSGVA